MDLRQVVHFVLLFSLLLSSSAFGWAPATHLFYAEQVFSHLHLLSKAMQSLLTHYRSDFLYGSLAADITLGKAFVEYIYNCHNFDVGLGLLKKTETDAEVAFVYGYNAHLAADTVSHNFFVPFENLRHIDNNPFRHAYWEVRLDHHFTEGRGLGKELEGIVRNPRNRGHDQLLDGALKDTIFSFKTNKLLFSSMLAIQRFQKWKLFVNRINQASPRRFDPKLVAEYNRLSVCAILRLLKDEKDSPVYQVDPTGKQNIELAKGLRKELQAEKKKRGFRSLHLEVLKEFRKKVDPLFDGYPIPGLRLKKVGA